jgi:hypothetical protein
MENNIILNQSEFKTLISHTIHSYLCICEKDIAFTQSMSINDFKIRNEKVIHNILNIIQNRFGYTITIDEIFLAIDTYAITYFKSKVKLQEYNILNPKRWN